jgi:SulP family sulfate permease
LLAVVLFLAPIVSLIPTAALAGILIGTSLRIANPQSVKEALQSTYKFRVIYVVTALAVVFIDLIWGVVIGIFLEKILNKAR